MTCLEAQSKIIAYIEYNLEKDEKQEFLKHIQSCEECREELVIYYTMIEGMRQLDDNMPLTHDFSEELNWRMQQELKSSRKKRELMRSSVGIVVIAILAFLIFGYVNFLNLLHEQEQAAIKDRQGDYYYSETFHNVLFTPDDEEPVLNINITKEEPVVSFYEKIRTYNILNNQNN